MSLVLIDAGGTISSLAGADGRLSGGAGGLQAAMPRHQVYAGLSEEMTLGDMARVRDAVCAALARDDVGGVVVAHGTDAMEETAWLTDLALGPCPAKPVIFTGSMLPMSAPDSDAPRNLADARRAAGQPWLAAHGALVCFAGHLIPAASVYKHSTHAIDGFGWRYGAAGSVGAEIVPPLPIARGAALTAQPLDRCAIVAISGGDDGAMIDAAVAAGMRAIVLMALGRGNVSAKACGAVERALAAGVAVAVASRCPTGDTAGDYATGARLGDLGAVFAGRLGPTQARMLLACLLAQGLDARAMAQEVARRA